MASYTEINMNDAQEILRLYGITGLTQLTPLAFGISNSNYKVILNTNDALILKISNDKNANELAGEQQVLQYLKQNGFPYSVSPYLTNEGSSVYEWESYTGVIFPFVAGEVPELNQENLFTIGAALARLHLTSEHAGNFSHLRPHTDVGFDLALIAPYCEKKECPKDFKLAFQTIFPEGVLKQTIQSNLPTGVIHGDMYYDNTLFRDGQLQAILDFEQSGTGEYLFDLGISISGSCLKNGDIDLDYTQAFVEGYESARELSKDEKTLLYYAILAGLFSISRWRIKRFIENKLDESKTENYKELLHRALRFHDKVLK